jgi:hypothetical protein
MAGFDSPSFKKNYPQQTHAPMREFNVGPPDEFEPQSQQQLNTAEIEQKIEEARREKVNPVVKISDTGKKRIEILANIGRLTKDVPIGGISFSLRTLKSKETEEATRAIFANSVTQLEASLEARKQQLARSIFKIDGQDIDFVIGSRVFDDKLAFIGELEDIVVDALWDNFTTLKNEARTKFGINNSEEAKEVIEDLKKS